MFYVQLQASNEDGTSPWSDVVQYRTLCDRPRPPSKPQTKGKLYPDSFRVIWGLYFPSVFPVSACVISRLHSLQAKATSYVLVCVLCFCFFCFFVFSFDATAQQRLDGFLSNLHQQKMSIFKQNILTPPYSGGHCMETKRNSGKTKTTGITTIFSLPSHPCLVKFGLGAFEL